MVLPQLAKQTAQWQEMSAGMDQQLVTGWLAKIKAWENDSSLPNPFQSQSIHRFVFGFTLY